MIVINAELFERFLAADPDDIGCDEVADVRHVYVDLLDAGVDAAAEHPGVAGHLASCEPCTDDVHGLLIAVRETHEDDSA